MKVILKDDPSIVNSIFHELKENINLNIAQDITHREKSLQKLIEGYEAFKPQFDEALKQDLGYNPFLSNFAAHSITLGEIKDLLSNLRQWAKPRSIPTPMGISLLTQHSESLNANLNINLQDQPQLFLRGIIPFILLYLKQQQLLLQEIVSS